MNNCLAFVLYLCALDIRMIIYDDLNIGALYAAGIELIWGLACVEKEAGG